MIIDKDETAARVDMVLSQYETLYPIANREGGQLQSPVISGMPAGGKYGNTNQDNIISQLDAMSFIKTVDKALKGVDGQNHTYYLILKYTYIKKFLTKEAIMEKVHLEKSAFYTQSKEAKCKFAEWCPPVQDFDNSENTAGIELLALKPRTLHGQILDSRGSK